MTDLKNLLEEAAGAEPGVTDADLTADLLRGQRALKRRRITGIAAGAVATALVIGVGWSVLPSGTTSGAPAASVTKKPTAPGPKPFDQDKRKPPVIPAAAVPLVANPKPFPGVITCDLIPKGWAVRIAYASPIAQQQDLYDPNLDAKKFHGATYTLTIRQTELIDEGEGPTVDKYSTPWTKLPKVRAGKYLAVTSGVPGSPNGRQEVYIKPGKSTKIVGVSNHAYNLAWDMNTLLKFAGSCHYK
ncbi:hypothetical protein GCM10009630_03880 [Kribbella jejuensis]|uniref:Uncharacterized protein n=1 Tax=Kribbella jejuensis TaxID=236068 RepID=A0A542EUA8_9ACTN|nr:hypothetical protein [Kribbella jejuensis]TQJ18905.1 hypothetical protein FB475_3059 [Kribbella jejuensis]